jgi:type IV pilus modification protein PilV
MKSPRMQAGFALIDSLIALLLFATVLLAVLAVLLRAMHATHDAVQTGHTVDLASDALETRRAQPGSTGADALADITLQ